MSDPRRRPSPADELDDLLVIVPASRWLVLLALVLVVAGGAAWAFLGSVPETVSLSGVLVRGNGPVAALAGAPGTLTALEVGQGDPVLAGQVLATVTAPDGQAQPVSSPATGRVVSALAAPGQAVPAGGPLVAVDPGTGPLRAVLLVPYRDGLPVRPGLAVRLRLGPAPSPAGAGGVVREVGAYPASTADLRGRFAGVAADQLSGVPGPWRLVVVDVAASGWAAVPSLTSVFADVTVSERRPVDILLGR